MSCRGILRWACTPNHIHVIPAKAGIFIFPLPLPQNTDPRLQPFYAIPEDDKGSRGAEIYQPLVDRSHAREEISSVIARERSDRGDLFPEVTNQRLPRLCLYI